MSSNKKNIKLDADIGIIILFLIKIFKIISGLQIMTIQKINLPTILITSCVLIMIYWFKIDIGYISQMSIFELVFNFGSIFSVSIFGLLILYTMKYKDTDSIFTYLKYFGLLILTYGFISFCDTATTQSYNTFGDIIYIGIIFGIFNISSGLILICADFTE